jgi:hypothetical protein
MINFFRKIRKKLTDDNKPLKYARYPIGEIVLVAIALLTAAIRGGGGCEVMSVPSLFTGKHTHLACLLFSPIDWCESQFK